MAVKYWVDDFLVDLSRNQITQKKQSIKMAPKALAVLTCLAENQGKVVSQDAILARIWQDTAVTPNTLQRSIAQLRKALGDNGKAQVYIKTHAKQGYSLECDVRWHDNVDVVQDNHDQENEIRKEGVNETKVNTYLNNKKTVFRIRFQILFAMAGVIVLSAFWYNYFRPTKVEPLSFDTLRSLTATDDKEFDATYTPDGQYIVFHRYLDKQCVNKLWAKNIRTQKETLLTENWGNYGSHSFSKDGKKLVFLATEPCFESNSQNSCYDLMSIDFEKALESPQLPSLMLRCENSQLDKPLWISDDRIAMLQRKSNRWKLIDYSVSENKCTDLYELEEGNIIDYAYSARDELLAIISFQADAKQYIEVLRPDGSVLSSHSIKFPPEITKFRPVYPNFSPLEEQLVFSTGRQLFTLSFEGEVRKISLPFAEKMGQPEFHPNGKKLLMLKGPYDSDIVRLPLDRITEMSPESRAQHTQGSYINSSFERSNLGEDYAIFQPGGELIAFLSERSGEDQLWISDGRGPQQLTHFPLDTNIRGIDWAKDGESLLVNANYVLTQVYLDSRQKSFSLEHPVVLLFQWDSVENSALLLVRMNGIFKFVECDLNTLELREINDKRVLCGLKSEDGRLIYKDHMGQFWQPGPGEDQRIKALENQGGRSKSFVMNGNVIYAINKENQLWSYDLNTGTFKILSEVGHDVDYLTDINQMHLLMTVEISAKKEIVELSMSE